MQDVIWEHFYLGHNGMVKRCITTLKKVHGEDLARNIEAQLTDAE